MVESESHLADFAEFGADIAEEYLRNPRVIREISEKKVRDR
jgi:hypothetical protein